METGHGNGKVNMRITVTTDGGFSGRGIGTATADDSQPEVREALSRARPGAWRDEYLSQGRDVVRYTLTAGPYRVSWTDGAVIPADLRELFDAVWRTR